MKKITLFLLIAIVFTACEDKIELDDLISYSDINLIINDGQSDTIARSCDAYLVFEVNTNNSTGQQAFIYFDHEIGDSLLQSDCINNIAIESNHNAQVFVYDDCISEDATWTENENDTIYLDDFAGQGDAFIGYRMGEDPFETDNYNYCYIKINLAADLSNLKIISRANNLAKGNSIKAGQME